MEIGGIQPPSQALEARILSIELYLHTYFLKLLQMCVLKTYSFIQLY